MSAAQLYIGAVAPESVTVTVSTGQSGVDLTTATAATFSVRKPSGEEVAWVGALSGATASSVTVTYELASGTSDIDEEGLWKVYVLLSVPGGTIRTSTMDLQVLGEYA